METNTDQIRKRQLAQIHMAKAQLGLDDDTYRAMLTDVAGVDSAGKLNAKQRKAVLERFEARGWKNKKHRAPAVTAEKAPYVRKIRALLADMKLPWAYATGIMKQQGIKAQRIEWCTNKELHSIVVSLVNRQKKLQDGAKKLQDQATCAKSQTDTNA